MPDLHNKNKCSGCGACHNICPKNAISMQGDEYGFYKPVIDKEKCIKCGLCERICPIDNYKSDNFERPKVFAFMNSDEIRAKSSSGGAFSAFTDYVLKQNGIVYGVVWDEDIKAIHYRATNTEEIERMHGSKYVQSDTKNTFKQAEEDLENGKLVLYTGTPCQIAGLKSFLQKDYENFITVDLVCHGSQSPLFLEKYKRDFLKNKKGEKIINIDFRSKMEPWGTGYHTVIKTDKKEYATNNIYVDCMDLTINECCLSCQYTGIPRVADITIGDFWGIDDYDITLNDKKGTSIIIPNSIKGKNVFEAIKSKYQVREVPIDVIKKHNPNIIKPTKKHPRRKNLLEDIKNNKSFNYCVKKYCKEPLYLQIYRLLPNFIKDFIKYKILMRRK